MPLSARQFHTSTHPSVANCPLSQGSLCGAPARHSSGTPLGVRVLPWPRAPSDRTRGFFFATAQAKADSQGRSAVSAFCSSARHPYALREARDTRPASKTSMKSGCPVAVAPLNCAQNLAALAGTSEDKERSLSERSIIAAVSAPTLNSTYPSLPVRFYRRPSWRTT